MTARDYKVLTLSRTLGSTEAPGANVPDDESLPSAMAPLGAQGWEWISVLRDRPTLALPCSSSGRAERALAPPAIDQGGWTMKTRSLLIPALGLGAALLAGAPALASKVAVRPALPAAAGSPAADHGAAVAAVDAMAAARWADASHGFDAAMQKAAPPAALEKIWQQLVAQYGPYRGHGAASDLPAPAPYRNVVVPVTFGKQVVGMQFSYDAQGAVAGLHLVPPPA